MRAFPVVLVLLAAGCCAPQKFAAESLVVAWEGEVDGMGSIRKYAEAGVAADPLLADDPALTPEDRQTRAQAKARRLRTIEEFGLTLKESAVNAR